MLPRHKRFPPLPAKWPEPIDLVHMTDVYVGMHARRFQATRVTTVHDMIPLDYATWWPIPHMRWRLSFLRSLRALRKTDLVVTPSEDARRRLMARSSLAPERVRAVPVLVPDSMGPPPAGNQRREQVILSLGTTAPYKNLEVLFHALTRPELRGARVIRVGTNLDANYPTLVADLGLEDRVEDLGNVSEERLIELMHTSTVLAQPSTDEGFGMPVAEAMASGLPVVGSDGGAIPEVLGGAGRVVPIRKKGPGPVNMDDVRDYAAAMAEVLETSAERERMSTAGIEQSVRFRAPAVRASLLDAYAAATRFAKARSGA
jgi:glycosyltransferase involved in cell wall biosynthesis